MNCMVKMEVFNIKLGDREGFHHYLDHHLDKLTTSQPMYLKSLLPTAAVCFLLPASGSASSSSNPNYKS